MKNDLLNYPSPDELRALESAAQRARSREILRLIRSGTAGAKALLERLAGFVQVGGRIGHA
jgi:ABC-type cobalamin transport system ATPase subunit